MEKMIQTTADLLIMLLLKTSRPVRVATIKYITDHFGPDGHTAQLPEKKGNAKRG